MSLVKKMGKYLKYSSSQREKLSITLNSTTTTIINKVIPSDQTKCECIEHHQSTSTTTTTKTNTFSKNNSIIKTEFSSETSIKIIEKNLTEEEVNITNIINKEILHQDEKIVKSDNETENSSNNCENNMNKKSNITKSKENNENQIDANDNINNTSNISNNTSNSTSINSSINEELSKTCICNKETIIIKSLLKLIHCEYGPNIQFLELVKFPFSVSEKIAKIEDKIYKDIDNLVNDYFNYSLNEPNLNIINNYNNNKNNNNIIKQDDLVIEEGEKIEKFIIEEERKFSQLEFIGVKSLYIAMINYIKNLGQIIITTCNENSYKNEQDYVSDFFIKIYTNYSLILNICPTIQSIFYYSLTAFMEKNGLKFCLCNLFKDLYCDFIFKFKKYNQKFISHYGPNLPDYIKNIENLLWYNDFPLKKILAQIFQIKEITEEKYYVADILMDIKQKSGETINDNLICQKNHNLLNFNILNITQNASAFSNQIDEDNKEENDNSNKYDNIDEWCSYIENPSEVNGNGKNKKKNKRKNKNKKKKNQANSLKENSSFSLTNGNNNTNNISNNNNEISESRNDDYNLDNDPIFIGYKNDINKEMYNANFVQKIRPNFSNEWLKKMYE